MLSRGPVQLMASQPKLAAHAVYCVSDRLPSSTTHPKRAGGKRPVPLPAASSAARASECRPDAFGMPQQPWDEARHACTASCVGNRTAHLQLTDGPDPASLKSITAQTPVHPHLQLPGVGTPPCPTPQQQ